MGQPEPGTVVAIKFPFSDLSQTKLRPALVLADVGRQDLILCQITSKSYSDTLAVRLQQKWAHSRWLVLFDRGKYSPPIHH